MNDNRIEEILKESWSPHPPDGMKERILRRSREEIAHKRTWVFPVANWKSALTTAAVLVIVFTNVSDYQCQKRIAAMMDGSKSRLTAPLNADSLLAQRREMEELFAWLPVSEKDQKGVDLP